MDGREKLVERLLGRDSVVVGVQFYCHVYVVHIVYSVTIPMVLNACCIYGFVCAYCTCCVGYRWCNVHVGYVVLCTDNAMYMLDV